MFHSDVGASCLSGLVLRWRMFHGGDSLIEDQLTPTVTHRQRGGVGPPAEDSKGFPLTHSLALSVCLL